MPGTMRLTPAINMGRFGANKTFCSSQKWNIRVKPNYKKTPCLRVVQIHDVSAPN